MESNGMQENVARVTRRQFFGSASSGVGKAALTSLLLGGNTEVVAKPQAAGVSDRGLPDLPHYLPRAKRVVMLWQGGGPSHVDLFDEKPLLRKMAGQDIPASVRGSTPRSM